MDINLTLVGQLMAIHILLASVVTFVYGRSYSPSAGGSILAIFAWLMPLVGPICFSIYLMARRESRRVNAGDNLESQI